MKSILLKDGRTIPCLGQGTFRMGDILLDQKEEIASLKWGIENGLNVLDSAESYGEGRSEELVGKVIKAFDRDKVFLVSKVCPHNAYGDRLIQSCEASLSRMKTDYLDLYLLHWRGNASLEDTVEGMEKLVHQGKIKGWGVSNFDVEDMEELYKAGGENCLVNQVLYHLGSRGVEVRLYPWLKKHNIALMSYCPLARAGRLKEHMLSNEVIQEMSYKYSVTSYQILLAFVLYLEGVFAIPKASSVSHVRENREAAEIFLHEEDYRLLDAEFPKPMIVQKLDML